MHSQFLSVLGPLTSPAFLILFCCLLDLQVPAMAAFTGSALFGLQVLIGILKVKKLDKQEKLITGTA